MGHTSKPLPKGISPLSSPMLLQLRVTSHPNTLLTVTSLPNLQDPGHQIHIHSTLQLVQVALPWDPIWMTTLRTVRRRMTANGMRIQTPLQREMRTTEILLPGRPEKTTSTMTQGVQLPSARRTTACHMGLQPGVDPDNTNHMQEGVGQEKRRVLGEAAKLVKYSVVLLRSV